MEVINNCSKKYELFWKSTRWGWHVKHACPIIAGPIFPLRPNPGCCFDVHGNENEKPAVWQVSRPVIFCRHAQHSTHVWQQFSLIMHALGECIRRFFSSRIFRCICRSTWNIRIVWSGFNILLNLTMYSFCSLMTFSFTSRRSVIIFAASSDVVALARCPYFLERNTSFKSRR